ncbi:hypothetical protein NKH61_27610 [Mesorhizobium sp. M1005]|uniref:hypothetical protein n=1 Tax=unclassified Mesorhizobium TaxID=325217 RepID=UPI00333B4B5C
MFKHFGSIGLLLLATTPALSEDDASLLVDMHTRALSCSALAFLAGDYQKQTDIFRFATQNLNLLMKLKNDGDPSASSWFAFKAYEIESRDYILGYDYADATIAAAKTIREERRGDTVEANKKVAMSMYERDQCPRVEKLIR